MEVIDATAMSQDEQAELGLELWSGEGGFEDMMNLIVRAEAGNPPTGPRTIETTMHGDSPEAAMGRLYKVRDRLHDAGVEASVELGDTAYELPSTTMYELRLHIEDGE
jgi:hypothetical protein